MKYFSETKDEVDEFFRVAEQIVRGEAVLNPYNTAMNQLVNGCKSPSEINTKKTLFYKKLKENRIVQHPGLDLNSENSQEYNLIDEDLVDKIKENYKLNNAESIMHLLNYINILRLGENNVQFEKAEYILLTGKNATMKIAWSPEVRGDSGIPLATTLSFFTNRLWFKLGKGFGGALPFSLDIVAKAQIAMSSKLSQSVNKKYRELQKEVSGGKITIDDAKYIYTELRQSSKLPEEISQEDVDSALDFLTEESIDRYKNELEFKSRQNEAERNEKNKILIENSKLKQELEAISNKEESKKKKQIRIIKWLLGLSVSAGLIYISWLFVNDPVFKFVATLVGIIGSVASTLSLFGVNLKPNKSEV